MTSTEAMETHDACIKALVGIMHKEKIELDNIDVGDRRGIRPPNRVTRIFVYRKPVFDVITAVLDGEIGVRTFAVTTDDGF